MLRPKKWWQTGKYLYTCEVTTTRVIVSHINYLVHDWETGKVTVVGNSGVPYEMSIDRLKNYFNTKHDAVHASLAYYSNIHPEDDYEVIELYNQYVEVLEKWLHMN